MTSAATRSTKSSLHNFTLPELKWGSQKHLRCIKIDSSEQSPPFKSVGIVEFRQKIMSDLKSVRDKIIQSMFRNEDDEEEEKDEIAPVKPWNLRKRRAVCKEPVELNPVIEEEEKEVVREKYSSRLSRKEVEEDYMKMLGCKPPRRPKKRLRAVQRRIDSLCPGFYLTEVTLDAYKVPEETKPKNLQR